MEILHTLGHKNIKFVIEFLNAVLKPIQDHTHKHIYTNANSQVDMHTHKHTHIEALTQSCSLAYEVANTQKQTL